MNPALAEQIFELNFRATFFNVAAGEYITNHFLCSTTQAITDTQCYLYQWTSEELDIDHNIITKQWDVSCCEPIILRCPYRIGKQFGQHSNQVYLLIDSNWMTYRDYLLRKIK